ncbi:MAG TPA: SDR family oxidoreductase [Candidatus Baltobacteraceae bacterium]|jgi:nucleoside-diphosphate-sugar epimerase|nr:SDR family oxidoreductase [Candidatus Baltobacteraceae bacterium]
MRVLIVGCGYVGLPLAAELARAGHEVFGVNRSPEKAAELRALGIEPLTADITKLAAPDGLPQRLDWVVNTVSSNKGGLEDYQRIFLEGTHHLVDWLVAMPLRKYVHAGSTSVYAQTDGSLVKETSPAQPTTEMGLVLAETEQALLRAFRDRKFPSVLLRMAGIYGPGRGHLFLKYLKDEARIAGNGLRLLNMIHRDDVVGAIIAALKNGRPGEIYNVVDDEPVPQIHFFRWLSETLGKNMPPFSEDESGAGRKRVLTHKKVSNRRLRMELGCPLRYPTFRQGYTAEIKRLEDAGEL